MRSIPPDHRVDTTRQASPNQLLAGVARRTSDGLLALLAGCGLVITAVVLVVAPERWAYALPALVMAAFGGWGILDRVADERRQAGRDAPVVDGLLDGARTFTMLAGWMCLIVFLGLVVWRPLSGVIH